MLDLTFGEQVKIILSRKGMTIKELAETIEAHTGKKMSRQNLTQRLGRDNFQEQDMRMIAEILGCPFHLNILDDGASAERSNHIEPDRTLEVSDKADASKACKKKRNGKFLYRRRLLRKARLRKGILPLANWWISMKNWMP